jgi:histidinol-phosphate aminotransferase
LLEKINEYPNLIVSQTFSKAWGMAAVRVGTAYASKEIIGLYNKVKPPYNVSLLNQQAVIDAMKNIELFVNPGFLKRQEARLEKFAISKSVSQIHEIYGNILKSQSKSI